MTETQDRLEERDRVATIRLILDAHERSGEPAGDVRWTDEAMRAVFTHYDAALRQSQDIEAAARAFLSAWHQPMKDYWQPHHDAFTAMTLHLGPSIDALEATLAPKAEEAPR